jgi:hypothetical protein
MIIILLHHCYHYHHQTYSIHYEYIITTTYTHTAIIKYDTWDVTMVIPLSTNHLKQHVKNVKNTTNEKVTNIIIKQDDIQNLDLLLVHYVNWKLLRNKTWLRKGLGGLRGDNFLRIESICMEMVRCSCLHCCFCCSMVIYRISSSEI